VAGIAEALSAGVRLISFNPTSDDFHLR